MDAHMLQQAAMLYCIIPRRHPGPSRLMVGRACRRRFRRPKRAGLRCAMRRSSSSSSASPVAAACRQARRLLRSLQRRASGQAAVSTLGRMLGVSRKLCSYPMPCNSINSD